MRQLSSEDIFYVSTNQGTYDKASGGNASVVRIRFCSQRKKHTRQTNNSISGMKHRFHIFFTSEFGLSALGNFPKLRGNPEQHVMPNIAAGRIWFGRTILTGWRERFADQAKLISRIKFEIVPTSRPSLPHILYQQGGV